MHLFVSIGWCVCVVQEGWHKPNLLIFRRCVCVCVSTKFGFDSALAFRRTRRQNLQRHQIYGYFMAFSQNCIIFNKLKLNENQQRRAGTCARGRAHHCNSNQQYQMLQAREMRKNFVNFELYSAYIWVGESWNCITNFSFSQSPILRSFHSLRLSICALLFSFHWRICCQSNFHHGPYQCIAIANGKFDLDLVHMDSIALDCSTTTEWCVCVCAEHTNFNYFPTIKLIISMLVRFDSCYSMNRKPKKQNWTSKNNAENYPRMEKYSPEFHWARFRPF